MNRATLPAIVASAALLGACARIQERHELEAGIAPPGVDVGPLLASPLTADSAVQIAFAKNPKIARSLAELEIERGTVLSASALEEPELDASVKFGAEEPAIELELSQSLTALLYSAKSIAIGRSELEAAKLRASGEVLAVAGEVRVAFYRHQAALQRLELADTILATAEASFTAATALHEAGNIVDLAYYREVDLLEEARLARSRAEVAADESAQELIAAIGWRPAGDRFSATPRLNDPPEESISADQLERTAIDRSLELAAARHRIAAAEQRAGLAETQRFLPDVGLGVSASREDEGAWHLGPSLSVTLPVFDRGYGDTVRAAAERERAQREYEQTELAVRAAARTIALRAEGARSRAKHYRDVVLPLRARLLEETVYQLNAMQAGVFQVLAAKREHVQAAREYVDELERFWIAREELEQLSRGRWVRGAAETMTNETAPAKSGRGGH